jgi:hypothetical protein
MTPINTSMLNFQAIDSFIISVNYLLKEKAESREKTISVYDWLARGS